MDITIVGLAWSLVLVFSNGASSEKLTQSSCPSRSLWCTAQDNMAFLPLISSVSSNPNANQGQSDNPPQYGRVLGIVLSRMRRTIAPFVTAGTRTMASPSSALGALGAVPRGSAACWSVSARCLELWFQSGPFLARDGYQGALRCGSLLGCQWVVHVPSRPLGPSHLSSTCWWQQQRPLREVRFAGPCL